MSAIRCPFAPPDLLQLHLSSSASHPPFTHLVANAPRDKTSEKLTAELDVERGKREKEEEKVGKAKTEKEELEAELQSLSRALFEEAKTWLQPNANFTLKPNRSSNDSNKIARNR
ncbi:hypothetical protein F5877DRAFT_71007 [Lentinula edodes]|nr:hypothetical protein F5877DRAFT_71007 [Lentinula edodes]